LIQELSPKRTIDSRYGRSRFYCCTNRILVRVFQQTARQSDAVCCSAWVSSWHLTDLTWCPSWVRLRGAKQTSKMPGLMSA